jgi:N-acylglucosamine 2-epimerase
LHNTVEKRREWLQMARHGVEFIRRHGFDSDGRMFFHVTRDGRPVRKRRYIFTEAFAAVAFAAYARATRDERAACEARSLFDLIVRHVTTPDLIPPKVDPATRPMKSLAVPMIVLVTAQILRDDLGDATYQTWVDRSIEEIERHFVKPERRAVLECVGPGGEFIDHFDGRTLNPGHAIEVAWFILMEAKRKDRDPHLLQLGLNMLDWMWKRGWDEEYGGILYHVDVKGLPVQEYWHDMKFWWPQTEAIIATLLAYRLTGDVKYAAWHTKIHDWTYAHFPDPEHGEWFGYLHRDGRLSVPLKGNLWKGPYHVARMQWLCWRLAAEIKRRVD